MNKEAQDQVVSQDEVYMTLDIAFINIVLSEWRELNIGNANDSFEIEFFFSESIHRL